MTDKRKEGCKSNMIVRRVEVKGSLVVDNGISVELAGQECSVIRSQHCVKLELTLFFAGNNGLPWSYEDSSAIPDSTIFR